VASSSSTVKSDPQSRAIHSQERSTVKSDPQSRAIHSQERGEPQLDDVADLPAVAEPEQSVIDLIAEEIERGDEEAVIAVSGVAGLFGFGKVSGVIEKVAPKVRGRLVVFFPGEHEDNNYRLLDARDGWNYLAIPIKAHDGGEG